MPNGNPNAKNFNAWKELIDLLVKDGHELFQVGLTGEEALVPNVHFDKSFEDIALLLKECDLFISVDNFFPHFANTQNRRGIVIWGQSDPLLFGYPTNINLLKSRKYLRLDQFNTWIAVPYSHKVFVHPMLVRNAVQKFKHAHNSEEEPLVLLMDEAEEELPTPSPVTEPTPKPLLPEGYKLIS